MYDKYYGILYFNTAIINTGTTGIFRNSGSGKGIYMKKLK